MKRTCNRRAVSNASWSGALASVPIEALFALAQAWQRGNKILALEGENIVKKQ